MKYYKTLFLVFVLLLVSSVTRAECVDTTAMLDQMEERFIELIDKSGDSVLLRVKIADESTEQAAGFQHICPERIDNTAILFIFGRAKKPVFHMNNVYANLDIAFINEQGLIGDIQLMYEEFSTDKSQLYPSDVVTKYALEAHQGYFEQNNIEAGKGRLKVDD